MELFGGMPTSPEIRNGEGSPGKVSSNSEKVYITLSFLSCVWPPWWKWGTGTSELQAPCYDQVLYSTRGYLVIRTDHSTITYLDYHQHCPDVSLRYLVPL